MNFLDIAKERYSCRSFEKKRNWKGKDWKNIRSSKSSTNSSKLSAYHIK